MIRESACRNGYLAGASFGRNVLYPELANILGGIGLFLIGMAVMTDGLKSLAGDTLRKALGRFTNSAVSGATTGAIATAIIQSSSATTIMAVGFVGAGLMTFTQALGVIFGANIGTTITGWFVALLGFKFDLQHIVMPAIFVGALIRLFGNGWIKSMGFALAGFGLIFVGIGLLQTGMEAFRDVVTPESFPPDHLWGRMLLVLIGIAITIVTQSSSAGVATAITALHVGNISLTQACALVIGMDVGTTATAAMAAVGGNLNARRTGFAHVVYNCMTGIGAFILLPFYVGAAEHWSGEMPLDSEIVLVAFHTLFNTLGVLFVLPFTKYFARLIIWMTPSADFQLTSRLEPSLLKDPAVALETLLVTLGDLTNRELGVLATLVDPDNRDRELGVQLHRIEDYKQAAEECRSYLNLIHVPSPTDAQRRRHTTAVHLLDHLARLNSRADQWQRLDGAIGDAEIRKLARQLANLLRTALASKGSQSPEEQRDALQQLETLWSEFQSKIEPHRERVITDVSNGDATAKAAIARLDAMRWLRRVTYHVYRLQYHLVRARNGATAEPETCAVGVAGGRPGLDNRSTIVALTERSLCCNFELILR
ncbi:MAG: Na/Pi symporter [Pirellulaceae bacterium]